MEISVAFQGGGAKIFELLATTHAFQEKEGPEIRFVRASGSSAGAIAAAMLATNCDIGKIVSDPDRIKKIIETNFPIKRMSKSNIFWRLGRGKPIFDENALQTAIIELFEIGEVDATLPIKDAVRPKTELRIARSNIRHKRSLVATEGSDIALWEALADSAAIPFAFRMPKSSNTPEVLDGGLFQNLPAKAATENLQAGQIPLGVSFKKQTGPDLKKAGMKTFSGAIIGSLIDERVEDSVNRIRPSHIIRLPNERDTFDFHTIFEGDFRADFDKSKDYASLAFDTWKGTVETLNGPDWHSDHPDDLREHIRRNDASIVDFFKLVKRDHIHTDEIHHEVVFNSWNHRAPDLCQLSLKISGKANKGLQFLQFSFYDSEEGSLGNASISVKDKLGEKVPALALPIRDTGQERARSIVIVLPHPLTEEDSIEIVKIEETFNSFRDYLTEGFNFQTIGLSPGKTSDCMKLSVHFPKSEEPDFFRDASREKDREAKDYDDDCGLQLQTSCVKETDIMPGYVTISTKVDLPAHSDSSERRFIKLVFCKNSR